MRRVSVEMKPAKAFLCFFLCFLFSSGVLRDTASNSIRSHLCHQDILRFMHTRYFNISIGGSAPGFRNGRNKKRAAILFSFLFLRFQSSTLGLRLSIWAGCPQHILDA
ncbi:hypothetical protein B0T17DRAFT_38478 [Bombardia bombarda]|uniref:Secreted protein n=1 Tax=Bombardia bombarda TaxID=252184 RepID=A0AA40CFB2_9PEZI|nr:hypothetical protein B0T17DRAFT_38478 [Bombardia bombarda]